MAGNKADAPVDAPRTTVHQRALANLFDVVFLAQSEVRYSPEEAGRKLLGPRIDCEGSGCRVIPFDDSQVSLPSVSRPPVDLEGALPAQLSGLVNPDVLLKDDGEDTTFSGSSYLDEVLRKDPDAYLSFAKRLLRLGLAGAASSSRCTVCPFFVLKSDGLLRCVWDCRGANAWFRAPPKMDIGGAATCATTYQMV